MKIKKCKHEGCKSTKIWSGGFCRFHTSYQPTKKSNKPIKKHSKKGLENREKKKENTKLVHEAMYNWWLKQPKNECMSCGCKLPKEFHTWMVDHLLEKSKYQQFDKDERNFFFCCLDCHTLKGNGFPTQKHKKAIEKAKYLLLYNIELLTKKEIIDKYGHLLTEEEVKKIKEKYEQ